jgi:hypothetical protein
MSLIANVWEPKIRRVELSMDRLLKVVGAVWAVLGAANIIGMPWTGPSSGILLFGIMFNMLLFVFPGLILYGVGAGISRRRRVAATSQLRPPPTEAAPPTVEERFKTLVELKDEGLITGEEYSSRHAELLRQV